MSSVEKAVAFVRAVEAWRPAEELQAMVSSDFLQEEMPNPFNRRGVIRGLAQVREAMRRGQELIANQRFDIIRQVAAMDTVVLEMIWTGSLRVRVGANPEGTQLRAKIAQVYELEDGRIARLRTYDCYEPL